MTENEVRLIVKETVNELRKKGYLKTPDDIAYAEISDRLYQYYETPENDPDVTEALEAIQGDRYFKIITMYYRDRFTIDWIAEDFNCETSTITRNKKRLCLRIYEAIQ